MANVENARDRLLCVLNILERETDPDHGLTIREITARLKEFGFEPDRKTLYADFRAITDRFAEVEKTGGNVPGYFIADRNFEVEELMVLMDAVESAGFMTKGKKEDLIAKLKSLASTKQAVELNSQLHYIGRHHSTNNNYIFWVSTIRRAMEEGHPVTFQYLDYSYEKKDFIPRHDGMQYIFHPLGMAWNNGFYYCIGTRPEQSEVKDKIYNLRIDRMKGVEIKTDSKLAPPPKGFDVAKHMESTFDMYGDKTEHVLLRLKKTLLTPFYDHFDMSVKVLPDTKDKDYVLANVEVSPSPTFYAWVSTFKGEFTILEPKRIRDEYHDHLRKALEA